MGGLRVCRTRAAAQTLARLLKKRCNIHVMLFGLPAAGDRTGETYWVRPCCQIYNSRSDFETLGHKVLEWAPLAAAADKALLWLRKVRPGVGALAEREEDEVSARSRSLHTGSLSAVFVRPGPVWNVCVLLWLSHHRSCLRRQTPRRCFFHPRSKWLGASMKKVPVGRPMRLHTHHLALARPREGVPLLVLCSLSNSGGGVWVLCDVAGGACGGLGGGSAHLRALPGRVHEARGAGGAADGDGGAGGPAASGRGAPRTRAPSSAHGELAGPTQRPARARHGRIAAAAHGAGAAAARRLPQPAPPTHRLQASARSGCMYTHTQCVHIREAVRRAVAVPFEPTQGVRGHRYTSEALSGTHVTRARAWCLARLDILTNPTLSSHAQQLRGDCGVLRGGGCCCYRLNPAFAAGALGHGAINGSPDSVLLGRSGMGDRCESWNSMDSMTSGLMHSASGLFNQAHGW